MEKLIILDPKELNTNPILNSIFNSLMVNHYDKNFDNLCLMIRSLANIINQKDDMIEQLIKEKYNENNNL